MASTTFSRLVTLVVLLCSTTFGALGVPAIAEERSVIPFAKRENASVAPYFVEYFDKGTQDVTGVPAVADVNVCVGYTCRYRSDLDYRDTMYCR